MSNDESLQVSSQKAKQTRQSHTCVMLLLVTCDVGARALHVPSNRSKFESSTCLLLRKSQSSPHALVAAQGWTVRWGSKQGRQSKLWHTSCLCFTAQPLGGKAAAPGEPGWLADHGEATCTLYLHLPIECKGLGVYCFLSQHLPSSIQHPSHFISIVQEKLAVAQNPM
jgi:hypothetical protein